MLGLAFGQFDSRQTCNTMIKSESAAAKEAICKVQNAEKARNQHEWELHKEQKDLDSVKKRRSEIDVACREKSEV